MPDRPWTWLPALDRHLLDLGAPTAIRFGLTVSRAQGLVSIRVTMDVYGHLVPGGNKAAVDRLHDAADATNRNPAATANRRS